MNQNFGGKLKKAEGQMDFEWKIPDFLSLSAQIDEWLESPEYLFGDTSWYIQMYPNGEKDNSSEEYIGIYVHRKDSGPPVTAFFSLFLKTNDGRKAIKSELKKTFKKSGSGWGYPRALKRSDVIGQDSEFLTSGALTVICSLKFHEEGGIKDTESLLSDLEGLALSGNLSDVTVKVRGEDFRLHKAILQARAPDFRVEEATGGVASLDDCDAGAFRAFVLYLYTGSAGRLPPEDVFGLYDLAVRYGVTALKPSCLFLIEKALAADTFCDVARFALDRKEQDLVERATDFLSENTLAVIGTQSWLDRLKDHPDQMNELLKQALEKKEKNQKPRS